MVEYFIASFAGYGIGRMGHIIGGSIWWIPHHWILGAVLIIAPVFIKKISWPIKIIIILFGLGIFASDFNDFLALKTFGADDVKIVKFWGID
jgi:hypothetical protein